MITNYYSFLKVGRKEHIERLFHMGEIYCNSFSSFSEGSFNDLREDPNEGLTRIIPGKDLKIKVAPNTFFTSEKCQFLIKENIYKGNIFCFFGLESKSIKPSNFFRKLNLDIDSINWGDTVVFIYDTMEFLRRMDEAISTAGFIFTRSPVEYYELENHSGKVTPFQKSTKYKDQKEIRYFIRNLSEESLKFYLGDLSDISFIIRKRDLHKIQYDYK